MRIAATYENGNIFQHFGRTETFKIYQVENNQVVSSEVVSCGGVGHGALAGLLSGQAIDVVICGGLGAGAQNALLQAGIEVISGAEGDADAAVAAYLRGDLVSSGANCDHHHGEDHECGHHEEDGACGNGGCCGNGGGCHEGPKMEGKNVGKNVRVHYRGTLNDGTQFDSSYDRGQTLDFVCGTGMMIPGFDKAVAVMEIGEIVDVHLMPEEAYGPSDPNAVFTVETAMMPGSESLSVGDRVYLQNGYGQPFPVSVTAKEDGMITFDANHELAGQELNFRIELVAVE